MQYCCRPPHGGRGLKPLRDGIPRLPRWSSSTRGTWIETKNLLSHDVVDFGRPPHGGRGLKHVLVGGFKAFFGRPPHGGRGLKLRLFYICKFFRRSSSTRGTWIETIARAFASAVLASSSTRGTWIETTVHHTVIVCLMVVLHTGDVD